MSIKKTIIFFKLCFILIRHGINPFSKLGVKLDVLKERLTIDEKRWLINITSGEVKRYVKEIFDL